MSAFTALPRFSFDVAEGGMAAIPDPRLQALAEYWFDRRENGMPPRRAAIDPLDFPDLLPDLLMLDRIDTPEGDRFRYRLVGTRVGEHVGRELTGQFLDEALPPSYYEFVVLTHRLALRRGLPVYASSLYHDEGNTVNALTYRLVMPLRTTEAAADLIFVSQFWQRRNDRGYWTGNWMDLKPEITVIAPPAGAA
ncbi:PAS domain-containing protein [Ferrovibrio sp.]|uniref:PAS domain-containing protein n=1 Tax=Ferrovibrio sp. TaxID=1917215 RepID=UPI00312007A2